MTKLRQTEKLKTIYDAYGAQAQPSPGYAIAGHAFRKHPTAFFAWVCTDWNSKYRACRPTQSPAADA